MFIALQSGKIKGAVLDVFATEPLPTNSPLYQLDSVLMSAHCADRTDDFQFQTLELFVEIMDGYLRGKPLPNIVDKNAGY